jgi:hypothetical protein
VTDKKLYSVRVSAAPLEFTHKAFAKAVVRLAPRSFDLMPCISVTSSATCAESPTIRIFPPMCETSTSSRESPRP